MSFWLLVPFINRVLLVLSILSGIFLLFVLSGSSYESSDFEVSSEEFLTDESILNLGDIFHLNEIDSEISLSQVVESIIYLGKNKRPDADTTRVYYSLKDGENIYESSPGNIFYLKVDKGKIVVVGSEEESFAKVVHMPSKEGFLLRIAFCNYLENYSEFSIPHTSKEIQDYGSLQVDTTLLSRQQCSWYGKDLFLNEHGGSAFSHLKDKEHLCFGKATELYNCYLEVSDALTWDGEKWRECKLGLESRGKPLLYLENQDDNALYFRLWGIKGYVSLPIVLVKSSDAYKDPLHFHEIRLVNARTKNRYLIETNTGQLTLGALDWLLFQDDKWALLTSKKAVEMYVEGQLKGELFVVECLKRQEGKPVLYGHIFNEARSIRKNLEIGIESKIIEKMTKEQRENIEQKAVQGVINEILSEFN